MKLIIDISEEDYKEVLEDTYSGTSFENKIFTAIANGTPLEEELHREKEQAYYLGYEDGRKSEWTAVAEGSDKE